MAKDTIAPVSNAVATKYATMSAASVGREIRYDPVLGEFWWLIPRRGRQLKRQAGTVIPTRSGLEYRVIMIDGIKIYAQVLAWLLMTGEWPNETVDHINNNSMDNKWSNLRLATHSQQNMNQRPRRPGLTGASFHKPSGLWQAYIKKGGKQVALGYFKTAEEAHEARKKAEIDIFGVFRYGR